MFSLLASVVIADTGANEWPEYFLLRFTASECIRVIFYSCDPAAPELSFSYFIGRQGDTTGDTDAAEKQLPNMQKKFLLWLQGAREAACKKTLVRRLEWAAKRMGNQLFLGYPSFSE